MQRPNPTMALVLALGAALAGAPAPVRAQAITTWETLPWATYIYSTSLSLDSQGEARIAYYNATYHTLWYAIRYQGDWLSTVVDDGPNDVGGFSSLALDATGNPHIAYFDETTDDLEYASGDLAIPPNWTHEVVDASPADVGRYCALALDGAGNPHISYWDASALDLKYARKSGGTWLRETVDAPGFVGLYTSIALDAAGNPHIAYYDDLNDNLKYARKSGGAWTVETVDAPGDVGANTSIALDGLGNPHVSYQDATNGNLKVASRSGGVWTVETADGSANAVGSFQTSIALDAYGGMHVSYHDATVGTLNYASKASGTWVTKVVDSGGTAGAFSSLRLSPAGEPRISYQEADLGQLHYAWVTSDQELFQGVTNLALGQATVSLQGGRLVVDNIGSSGHDGVVLQSPHESSLIQWRPLGDVGTYGAGAFVEISAVSVNPNPIEPSNLVYAQPNPCRLTGLGSALEFAADFSGVGSPTQTVQVLDGGATLLERSVQPGPIMQVQTWPISAGSLIAAPATSANAARSTGGPPAAEGVATVFPRPGYAWRWASSLPITVPATPTDPEVTLMGDEVRILAGAPTVPVSHFAEVRLLARGIPTIRIDQETAAPVGVGEPASRPGGAWLMAYPNPARGAGAQISLHLPRIPDGDGELAVFDLAGRHVRTLRLGSIPTPAFTVRWDGAGEDGRPAPAGLYLVRFRAAGQTAFARLVLLE